jgi:hypothetical protein
MVAGGLSLVGCGGAAGSGDEGKARAAMRMVGIEYGRYLAQHNGAPPPDEAAFGAFLDAQIKNTPDYGVASAGELLAATRDGGPLVVIYGKKVAPPDAPDLLWAAYEKTGVDGMRLVVNARGLVTELAADEVERIIAQ